MGENKIIIIIICSGAGAVQGGDCGYHCGRFITIIMMLGNLVCCVWSPAVQRTDKSQKQQKSWSLFDDEIEQHCSGLSNN